MTKKGNFFFTRKEEGKSGRYKKTTIKYLAPLILLLSIFAPMESTRQLKIAKLLQKELGEIFQKNIAEIIGSYAMVTVTKVNVTKDLSQAKVYISIFGIGNKENTFKQINKAVKTIRVILAGRIRHQVRAIPELLLYQDDSLDYIEHIDNLLKND